MVKEQQQDGEKKRRESDDATSPWLRNSVPVTVGFLLTGPARSPKKPQ